MLCMHGWSSYQSPWWGNENGDCSFLCCFQHVCSQIVSWAREAPGHPELQQGRLSPGETKDIDAQQAIPVLAELVCLNRRDYHACQIVFSLRRLARTQLVLRLRLRRMPSQYAMDCILHKHCPKPQAGAWRNGPFNLEFHLFACPDNSQQEYRALCT